MKKLLKQIKDLLAQAPIVKWLLLGIAIMFTVTLISCSPVQSNPVTNPIAERQIQIEELLK